MIDEHTREDELLVQIIGLKGKIENLKILNVEKKKIIRIVQRLIELKKEYWNKGNKEESYSTEYYLLHGKSNGIEKALEVIDGLLGFDVEIHQLIDDSRK